MPAAAFQAPGEKPEQRKQNDPEKRLLEVGKTAPDFSLPLLGGGEVALANLLKFGKGVLVVFWAIDEKEGGADLPKLQKLNDELSGKGLTTVTINPRDEAEDVQEFLEEQKVQLQTAIDGKETNRAVTGVFKARTLPTYYLLDPTGKVLYRSVGLKEGDLRAATAKAGIK